MKFLPLAFLCLISSAFAAIYTGDFTFSPGDAEDSVIVTGSATLDAPGHYIVESFTLTGNLIIPKAGTYTVTATDGGIIVTGDVIGPASGSVVIVVQTDGSFTHTGSLSSNVKISRQPLPDVPTAPDSFPAGPLLNLSVRSDLPAGRNLIQGFVVGESGRRVLVRAVGPGLAPLGVSGVMADPVLTLFRGDEVIATNDDWSGLADVFAAVSAFGLADGSKDAALLVTLPAGSYTAHVSSATGGGGEVIAEVYLID